MSKNTMLQTAKLFVENELKKLGVNTPDNFQRLRLPGLRRLLVEAEVTVEVLDDFDKRFLPSEPPKGASAPKGKPEEKEKEGREALPTTAIKKKITLAKVLFSTIGILIFLWLTKGNPANIFGMVGSQVTILWFAILAFKAINGAPKKVTKKPFSERLKAVWERLNSTSATEALAKAQMWLKSGRVPMTVFLLTGTLSSIQLVHSADGDPNNGPFSFAINPNWVMVLAGVGLMIIVYWLVIRMTKGDFSPKVIWIITAMAIVITVFFTFGVADFFFRKMAPHTPITTIQ